MQADELVLDLSVTPEPDGAVVTGRNEDVAGQLSNEIGISSFTAPLTTRLPIVTLELKNVWTNIC